METWFNSTKEKKEKMDLTKYLSVEKIMKKQIICILSIYLNFASVVRNEQIVLRWPCRCSWLSALAEIRLYITFLQGGM